jgi:hypothetical protein
MALWISSGKTGGLGDNNPSPVDEKKNLEKMR